MKTLQGAQLRFSCEELKPNGQFFLKNVSIELVADQIMQLLQRVTADQNCCRMPYRGRR